MQFRESLPRFRAVRDAANASMSGRIVQLLHRGLSVVGMVLLEVIVDVVRVRCGGSRSAEAHHLGTQHLLETPVHVFFFNQLATLGLRDTLAHGGAETGFFLKQAQRRVLYQVFGVGP